MHIPKIISVQPQAERKLLVKFSDGAVRIYDCAHLLHLEAFQLLQNKAFFKAVRVDPGGYGISWNDDVDLSGYELWTNSVEPALT